MCWFMIDDLRPSRRDSRIRSDGELSWHGGIMLCPSYQVVILIKDTIIFVLTIALDNRQEPSLLFTVKIVATIPQAS